jgi:hypothetical protein
MHRLRYIALSVAAVPLLAACDESFACLQDAPPAIALVLTDEVTNFPIDGAKGVVRDGNYTDSLYFVGQGLYIAASQRRGTYTVHAEHPEYVSFDTAGLRASKGFEKCSNVETVRIERTLKPLP